MKKILFSLLFFPIIGFCQQKIGNQLVDSFPINNWSVPARYYGLTWLPDSYANSIQNYPLVIHLHGDGEKGSGVAGLKVLCNTSLPQRIANGFKPWAKGQEFIVISPQSPTSPGLPEEVLQYMLADIIKRYRVDVNRIYVTGYSYGGHDTWTCVADELVFAKKIAAILPVSSAAVEGVFNNGGTIINRVANIPINVSATKMPVWNICGILDGMITYADAYTTAINAVTLGPKAKETRLAGVGHSAWNQSYDTSFRPNGLNFLEWMLQYSLAPVVSPKPVARISIDSATINNPNSFVRVNADSSLRAVTWQWVQYSGPSAAIWTPIAGTPHKADMLVSGLFPGTYVFGLFVNDSLAQMDSTKVIVTVKPVYIPPIPAPRMVTGIQITINGQVFTIPLIGAKFTFNDGSTQ